MMTPAIVAACMLVSGILGAGLAVFLGIWYIKRMDMRLISDIESAMGDQIKQHNEGHPAGNVVVIRQPMDTSGLPRLN
jgi:hypothetical protein